VTAAPDIGVVGVAGRRVSASSALAAAARRRRGGRGGARPMQEKNPGKGLLMRS
jgi:hypothetical protein